MRDRDTGARTLRVLEGLCEQLGSSFERMEVGEGSEVSGEGGEILAGGYGVGITRQS